MSAISRCLLPSGARVPDCEAREMLATLIPSIADNWFRLLPRPLWVTLIREAKRAYSPARSGVTIIHGAKRTLKKGVRVANDYNPKSDVRDFLRTAMATS